MDPGALDKRVTFLRRPVEDETSRGPYEDVFTVWGGFKPLNIREATEGGTAQNIEDGTLLVRTSTQTRTITNADRVRIDGRDFAINGVPLPDRRFGTIKLSVTSSFGGQ